MAAALLALPFATLSVAFTFAFGTTLISLGLALISLGLALSSLGLALSSLLTALSSLLTALLAFTARLLLLAWRAAGLLTLSALLSALTLLLNIGLSALCRRTAPCLLTAVFPALTTLLHVLRWRCWGFGLLSLHVRGLRISAAFARSLGRILLTAVALASLACRLNTRTVGRWWPGGWSGLRRFRLICAALPALLIRALPCFAILLAILWWLLHLAVTAWSSFSGGPTCWRLR